MTPMQIQIEEESPLTTVDVEQATVANGYPEWRQVVGFGHRCFFPKDTEVAQGSAIVTVQTCLETTRERIKLTLGRTAGVYLREIEPYGNGGARVYKDRMVVDWPYTYLIGNEPLVFVRRIDNTVDVYTVPK